MIGSFFLMREKRIENGLVGVKEPFFLFHPEMIIIPEFSRESLRFLYLYERDWGR